jgi:hypothetical protein
MIEGAQRMIRVNYNSQQEPEIPINPAMKRHFELEIETLQNAPRDEEVKRAFGSKAKIKRRSNAY